MGTAKSCATGCAGEWGEGSAVSTIRDVARLAAVSPSTVSRVLAGSTRISQDTHDRVHRAMDELNYHPHAIAVSLARRSSQSVGMVIARPPEQAFANPFFAEVIRGIGSRLHEAGLHLLLSFTPTPDEAQRVCLGLLQQRRVDGVILTSARQRDPLIAELHREQHPFVLIGRPAGGPPISWVNNDDVAVGAQATEHLIGRGHRRIALIVGARDEVVSLDRREGWARALLTAGAPVPPEYVVEGSFTQEGAYQATQRLLSLPEPPTAVVAADDLMALGVLRAARKGGRRVPGDLALVGVNDDPISAHVQPPLTTVRIPVFELGATAADTLVTLLARGSTAARQVVLPSELVLREST